MENLDPVVAGDTPEGRAKFRAAYEHALAACSPHLSRCAEVFHAALAFEQKCLDDAVAKHLTDSEQVRTLLVSRDKSLIKTGQSHCLGCCVITFHLVIDAVAKHLCE